MGSRCSPSLHHCCFFCKIQGESMRGREGWGIFLDQVIWFCVWELFQSPSHPVSAYHHQAKVLFLHPCEDSPSMTNLFSPPRDQTSAPTMEIPTALCSLKGEWIFPARHFIQASWHPRLFTISIENYGFSFFFFFFCSFLYLSQDEGLSHPSLS